MTDNSKETRTARGAAPWVDTQSLSDTDTYVYETIATLEYAGLPADRRTIAIVADLDDSTLDKSLADLTSRGVLTTTREGSAAYVTARRDWSASPELFAGHPMA